MVRKYTSRLIPLALCLLALVPACTPEPLGDDIQGHALIPGSDCQEETEMMMNEKLRTQGKLEGDIDGDGKSDEVFIVALPNGGVTRCGSFVVVETGGATFSVPADDSDQPRSLPVPRLNSLAQIDGEPGLEIVVDIEAGASTQFVSIFTLDDKLELMALKGKGPGPFSGQIDNLFAYGGSVGHLDGVDCAEGGYVVMTAAVPSGDTADAYRVERRYFLATGSTLVLDKERTEHETVTARDLDELTELTSAPFGSCN
jgi:hypothetical protein